MRKSERNGEKQHIIEKKGVKRNSDFILTKEIVFKILSYIV